jgi:protein involved in polysaccharide export with SLBB domain
MILNTIKAHSFWTLALCLSGIFSLPVHADTASVTDNETVCRAGEGLSLRVPLDTASIFNGVFPIDSTGFTNLPVLGRYYADNKSTHEIEAYIAQNAAPYLKDIHVTATPVIRLAMLGFWQRPGMHYANSETSIWEACLLVGGPGGEVNIQKWKVMRGTQVLNISLLDEFSRGTTLRDAGIKSGDIFIIPVPNPQSGFWYWFTQSLSVTAQLATITASVLTAYVTYLIVDHQVNNP